mmetsp:Transcript_13548/g.53699  ORF Transcript_13548/g.53699 Transcript_13548/m.53699 type:complete len:221 (-) Transcript_13548:1196-1858(-)
MDELERLIGSVEEVVAEVNLLQLAQAEDADDVRHARDLVAPHAQPPQRNKAAHVHPLRAQATHVQLHNVLLGDVGRGPLKYDELLEEGELVGGKDAGGECSNTLTWLNESVNDAEGGGLLTETVEKCQNLRASAGVVHGGIASERDTLERWQSVDELGEISDRGRQNVVTQVENSEKRERLETKGGELVKGVARDVQLFEVGESSERHSSPLSVRQRPPR